MNDLTEAAFRNVLSLDPEITPEQTEKFLCTLDPKRADTTPLLQVIRYSEAIKLLACSRSTIKSLIRDGYLTRVYGSGTRFSIGISAESYHRFINDYSRRKVITKETPFQTRERMRRANREQHLRKIRWSYHFNAATTRTEKYEAIARLLASNKKISRRTACLAAGIPLPSFRNYLRSLTRPQSNKSKRLARAADIISQLLLLNQQPPALRQIQAMLVRHGVNTTIRSIARILDELGYKRVKAIKETR